MDESGSAALHRFRSFCRLLMLFHPRVGAGMYAAHLFGHKDLKTGWNAMHSGPAAAVPVRYIKITPEGGLNSETKPNVPDSEIHEVRESDLPPYRGSIAQRHLEFTLELLALKPVVGVDVAILRQVLALIEAAAEQPLRGPTPSVDQRIASDLEKLKRSIASNSPVSELTAPLREIIREGMQFRLSITHASNVLAILIAHYLRLPSPLDASPLLERISKAVDHLTDRVVELKDQRQGLKLTPFFDATCLALLFGNTVLLLCRQAAAQCPADSPLRRSFERRGLYIDELMAHEFSPSLMHPVDLVPCVPAEYLHAVNTGITDANGMYQGAAGQAAGPVDVEAMWPMLAAYADGAANCDILATLDAQNEPLSPADRDRIKMFLLTMQVGRA